jgi:heterotetrameric sarcosine oxidase gamma subunit
MLKGCVTVVDSVSQEVALRRSPFEGHAVGARPTRSGDLGVHLRAFALPGAVLVGTWHSAEQSLCAALGHALAVAVPVRTGYAVNCGAGLLVRNGPQEFLLLPGAQAAWQPGIVDALRQSIPADVGSVTDLSHARCCIHIEGPRCLATLSKLFALDFRVESFPVHELRLSGHHHVPCLMHRLGENAFDLVVFTTFAHDQLGTVLDAAQEYGVSLDSMGT